MPTTDSTTIEYAAPVNGKTWSAVTVEVPRDLHGDGVAAAIAGWIAHHTGARPDRIGYVVRRYPDLHRATVLPACRLFKNNEGWTVAVAIRGEGPVIGQTRGVVSGPAAEPWTDLADLSDEALRVALAAATPETGWSDRLAREAAAREAERAAEFEAVDPETVRGDLW